MVRGSCLCGGIEFEVEKVPLLTNCHCSKCRKARGAAFNTTASVSPSQFRFLRGEDLLEVYQQSPGRYSTAFCRICGSAAPFKSGDGKIYFIPAGLLDDDPGVRPALHLFVGSKAPWGEITDQLPQFEEWVPGYGPDESKQAARGAMAGGFEIRCTASDTRLVCSGEIPSGLSEQDGCAFAVFGDRDVRGRDWVGFPAASSWLASQAS